MSKIFDEGASALGAMLVEDPGIILGMDDEKLRSAVCAADRAGLIMRSFLKRVAVLDEKDEVILRLVPILCDCGRKEQLRAEIHQMPVGTFCAWQIAPAFDKGEDLDFLVATARATYRTDGVFLGLDDATLDRYWRSRVDALLARPDHKRAWDDIKKAIRGFLYENERQSLHYLEQHLRDRHVYEGWGSLELVAELVDRLHGALVAVGKLPQISDEQTERPAKDEAHFAYTRKKKGVEITYTTSAPVPGWNLADLFPNGEKYGMFNKTGHQILALAKHFSSTNWV